MFKAINKNRFNTKEMNDYTSRTNFQRTDPSLAFPQDFLSISMAADQFDSTKGRNLSWKVQNVDHNNKTIHIWWRNAYTTFQMFGWVILNDTLKVGTDSE